MVAHSPDSIKSFVALVLANQIQIREHVLYYNQCYCATYLNHLNKSRNKQNMLYPSIARIKHDGRGLKCSLGGKILNNIELKSETCKILYSHYERHVLQCVVAALGLSYERYGEMVVLSSTQLSAISRLFSSAVFREMASKGRSPLFARLIGLTDIANLCSGNPTVGGAFDAAFGVLKTAGYRDEYIYRSALTHNILMGTHSLKTACMLTEFRVGSCKADLAILNGTATVYEIKSERDSLTRLRNQVENYKRVFAKVFVIASQSHVAGVLDTVPDDVGVMMLASRYRISTVREAEDRPERICPGTVFEALRAAEAAAILGSLKIAIPDVPNMHRHAAMRALFEELNPAAVHIAMVKTLKQTRDLAPLSDLVDCLPRSLHAAALSIKVRRVDHDRVVRATSTPLSAAMGWV